MNEIVLNEVEWVERALEAKSLGKDPSETLGRLGKYYFAQGHTQKTISRLLEEFLIRCDPNINLIFWQDMIDFAAKRSNKYPLVTIDKISVTQSELDRIGEIDGSMAQRVLFTILCLAKYNNAINPNGNNWANRDFATIFSLANVKVTKKRQYQIINCLWNNGVIRFSNVVDNLNLNVLFVDNEGEAVLTISDTRNLGNQYMMYRGENFMACESCGLIIRKTSNARKYCPECAMRSTASANKIA